METSFQSNSVSNYSTKMSRRSRSTSRNYLTPSPIKFDHDPIPPNSPSNDWSSQRSPGSAKSLPGGSSSPRHRSSPHSWSNCPSPSTSRRNYLLPRPNFPDSSPKVSETFTSHSRGPAETSDPDSIPGTPVRRNVGAALYWTARNPYMITPSSIGRPSRIQTKARLLNYLKQLIEEADTPSKDL